MTEVRDGCPVCVYRNDFDEIRILEIGAKLSVQLCCC